MKKLLPFTLLAFLFILAGCKKDDDTPETGYDLKVYTNTSGDPNADALIAHMENKADHSLVDFYGTFNTDNSPKKVRTVTFQRAGNDTTVYFLLNDTTGMLQTAYASVNGTKQPWVVKHDYIAGNNNAVVISIYEYDWSQHTSTLRYQSSFENVNGTVTETPIYGNFKTDDLFNWGAVAAGFVVAEAAFYGTSVGFLSTAAGAALVGAAGSMVAVGAAAIAVVAAIDYLTNDANASELTPGQYEYPEGTPIPNPTMNNNPTPDLNPVPSVCETTVINFNGDMDAVGNILVENLTGGVPPYSYSLGFPLNFQSDYFFYGDYPAGNYWITVQDGNHCMKSRSFNLNREPDPDDCIDIDGNIYQTVQIGSQLWMAQNLRTSRYNDGTVITTGLDDTAWPTYFAGACASYNDNPANDAVYGKLYNKYAVADNRKLCPQGWHVPNDSEWSQLINYSGGNATAGNALKSASTWNSSLGISNSTGFSALAAGARITYSPYGYLGMGDFTYFWSSAELSMYGLISDSSQVFHMNYGNNVGFSCRCVKD